VILPKIKPFGNKDSFYPCLKLEINLEKLLERAKLLSLLDKLAVAKLLNLPNTYMKMAIGKMESSAALNQEELQLSQ
jgi:hypothetical protein